MGETTWEENKRECGKKKKKEKIRENVERRKKGDQTIFNNRPV
jgi:hypothetical protein